MVDNGGKSNDMERAFGLWRGKGKVAYTSYVKEDLTIPAGAKILVFENGSATADNRQPNLRVVFVLEENQSKQ